ncbi:MAG TPA: hypothetical protein O0X66_03525 [Methanocorpusculum sp.]|nr:hypothetical protein [Methanocorpusculum sp.]HJJ53554.1 hypothetical protein [Methanocorpusculum sp.]
MKQWYEYPILSDRERFLELMRSGMTVRDIALQIGCPESAVRTAERRHKMRRPVVIISDELRRKLEL